MLQKRNRCCKNTTNNNYTNKLFISDFKKDKK